MFLHNHKCFRRLIVDCECLSLSVLKDLVLIPVHTKPKDSQKELDELYDVFLHVKDKWKTDVSLPLCNHNTFQRKSILLFVLDKASVSVNVYIQRN